MTTGDFDASGPIAVTRQLGGQTIVVLVGNAFAFAVSVPLQIYVARVLGPDGLGIFSLIEGAILTVTGLLGLGVAPTLVRFIPTYLVRGDAGKVRELLRFGALIAGGLGIAAYLIMLLSLHWIDALWPRVAGYNATFVLMGLMIPFGLALAFLQQGLRGFQEIRMMTLASSVVQTIVKAGVTVAAFAAGLNLNGYILATVLGALAAVIFSGGALARLLSKLAPGSQRPAAADWGEWRRFALVAYSMSLLSVVTIHLDRFLLGYFADSSAVGIFAALFQLQLIPFMFLQLMLVVGSPMFSAAHGRNNAAERRHLYHLMTDWAVRASLPIPIFLILFAQPTLELYGASFALGGTLSLIILMSAQIVHPILVGHAAISRNGQRVVSTSRGKIAWVWDVATREPVAVLTGHAAPVSWAAFSQDGTRVVTASADKTARVWRVFPTKSDIVDYGRNTVPRCLTHDQRAQAQLVVEPPDWCIELSKWPYETQEWKDWLSLKRAGSNPPMPEPVLPIRTNPYLQ